MQIGLVGLGRMGANMSRRWVGAGHEVVGYDRSAETVAALAAEGAISSGVDSPAGLVRALAVPRVIWLMVPAAAVDAAIEDLLPGLSNGDIIVDGGNSNYRDDIRRATELQSYGIDYVDCGTSGGVWGLERGYCLMIGGSDEAVTRLDPVLRTLAPETASSSRKILAANPPSFRDREANAERDPESRDAVPLTPPIHSELGYLHCGPAGAGHFVKMVHNGIEYALMAAYAEGFSILQHAGAGKTDRRQDAETSPLDHPEHYQYDFDLAAIAELWRHGSVISSWLLDLTAQALADSPQLAEFEGVVADSGEGRWTSIAAIESTTPAPVLTAALYSRFASRGEADFASKVLSAMRLGFGGHVESAGDGELSDG
jgi:6-phosphogluconate dehydrogenase